MLTRLLEVNNLGDPMGVEETRMRAATLLCKVFNTTTVCADLPVDHESGGSYSCL